jgi:hypothetical protein
MTTCPAAPVTSWAVKSSEGGVAFRGVVAWASVLAGGWRTSVWWCPRGDSQAFGAGKSAESYTGGPRGGTVTATWNGIEAPSPTDWVALRTELRLLADDGFVDLAVSEPLTVTFTQTLYPVTLAIAGAGSGTATGGRDYAAGATVTLTATPAPDSQPNGGLIR